MVSLTNKMNGSATSPDGSALHGGGGEGARNEHNEDAYGEQRRGAIAVGGCPDLNGAACSARTEMERACERMEFCGANEISRAPTGQVSGEPDAQRGFTGAIL